MFKRFFSEVFPPTEEATAAEPLAAAASRPAANGPASEAEATAYPQPIPISDSNAKPVFGKLASIEEIYQAANLRPTKGAYNIIKVLEMVNSPHLASLGPEAKRGAVLMALEAAGVLVEDVLQDAMYRQRILNDYEEGQQKKLSEFEAGKHREHSRIEAELERVSAQYQARMTATLDELERERDSFQQWQKRKEQAMRGIADAASFCVPQGAALKDSSLNVLFERAAAAGQRH
jgi:hypothetical protein